MSNERVKKYGEVFTPPTLVNDMLDRLPQEVWTDPTMTWLEPAAGTGNFVVEIIARLLAHGHSPTNIASRLYAVELLPDNHQILIDRSVELLGEAQRPAVEQRMICGNALEIDWDNFDV